MAILQALLLALTRRAGQVVNTLFGWATQLIFGRVSQDRQIYISIMTFGSVAWLLCVIGVVLPSVGAFLLAFVRIPRSIDPLWVRLAMAGAALALPLLVGALGIKVDDEENRPKHGVERIKQLFRGYPYTLGLALTLLLASVFAPFLLVPTMARRWITVHVPLIVASERYEAILEDVEAALAQGGWKTRRTPASWMVRLPTRILVKLAGRMIDRFVAEGLVTLRAPALEATLHPADLVLSGSKFDVARARALLTEALAFSRANQTWSREAGALEDRMTGLWEAVQAGRMTPLAARRALESARQERDRLKIDYEEWEILERQQLLIERALIAPTPSVPVHTSLPAPNRADTLVGAALVGGLVLLGHLSERLHPQRS